MQPTWRRLATGTGAMFLIILAFLAGRVRGGNDPALRDAQPARAPAQVTPADPQPAQGEDAEPEPDPGFAEPPVTRAS